MLRNYNFYKQFSGTIDELMHLSQKCDDLERHKNIINLFEVVDLENSKLLNSLPKTNIEYKKMYHKPQFIIISKN